MLLDDLSCHEQPPFLNLMKIFGTDMEVIAGGCKFVLQPSDVKVRKLLKGGMQKYYMDWASSTYSNLNSNQRLPILNIMKIICRTAHSFYAIHLNAFVVFLSILDVRTVRSPLFGNAVSGNSIPVT